MTACAAWVVRENGAESNHIYNVMENQLPKTKSQEKEFLNQPPLEASAEDRAKGRSKGDPYTRWQNWLPQDLCQLDDPYKKQGAEEEEVTSKKIVVTHTQAIVGRGLEVPVSIPTELQVLSEEERCAVVRAEDVATHAPYVTIGRKLQEHKANLEQMHAERDHEMRQIEHMRNEKHARFQEEEAEEYAALSERRCGPYMNEEGNVVVGYHQVFKEHGLEIPGMQTVVSSKGHLGKKDESKKASATGVPLIDDEGFRMSQRRPGDLRRPVKEGVPAELCGGFQLSDQSERDLTKEDPASQATVLLHPAGEDIRLQRARDCLSKKRAFQNEYERVRLDTYGVKEIQVVHQKVKGNMTRKDPIKAENKSSRQGYRSSSSIKSAILKDGSSQRKPMEGQDIDIDLASIERAVDDDVLTFAKIESEVQRQVRAQEMVTSRQAVYSMATETNYLEEDIFEPKFPRPESPSRIPTPRFDRNLSPVQKKMDDAPTGILSPGFRSRMNVAPCYEDSAVTEVTGVRRQAEESDLVPEVYQNVRKATSELEAMIKASRDGVPRPAETFTGKELSEIDADKLSKPKSWRQNTQQSQREHAVDDIEVENGR